MKLTPHITAQEVIPQSVWRKYGPHCIRFIDRRIVEAKQAIRNRFGTPRYMNTWSLNHWSSRDESGLRVPGHKHYNESSQHAYGRALDSISDDVLHMEVWEDILTNPEWYWDAGVTVVESINIAEDWLHIDCRGYTNNGQKIDELMITEKHNGQWVLMTVDTWIREYSKETKFSFGI